MQKKSFMNPHTHQRPLSAEVHRDINFKQSQDVKSSNDVQSDCQHGSPSSGNHRVFPIRSVVGVNPTPSPSQRHGRRSTDQESFPSKSTARITTQQDWDAPLMAVSPDTDMSNHPVNHPWKKNEILATSQSLSLPTLSRAPVTERQSLRPRSGSASSNHSGSDKQDDGQPQVFTDKASERFYESASPRSFKGGPPSASLRAHALESQDGINGGHVTTRFKHIFTAEGHAVITGRDRDTLQRCEDEPIHIPGAIQAFGLLIALQEQNDSQLVVRIVSENSQRMIGYTPAELFKLESFTDILTAEQTDNLLDHIDFIQDEDADPATNGPEVFTISVRPPRGKSAKMWCAVHVNPSNPDLIICEFEFDDDQMYPLVPLNEGTADPPEDTLGNNPTLEELYESTHNASRPLRVLRSARKQTGEAAAMEVFNIMSQVQEQLASASNLDIFLKILVGVVKEVTGFHRVMIYQFDSACNGRVVTELVDPRATKDLYKGLNFPASDIPKQARDMYKINKVRLLYDRDLETARLVCRTLEDLETPLDLSFSYLRAMSPVHLKYLANMAVRSSMSVSINAFGELWGLIACHSYGSKGMRVSFPIRKMCRLIGDTASRNIERLSYASRLQARKLINTIPTETNPAGYITASSDDLLTLFDADFGLLSIRGETKILGQLEESQEVLAMLEYLRLRKMTSVVTSEDIRGDFPDIRYPPGFTVIAGLLLVPLSVAGNDFIVFFRKGQLKEVKWAGNPYEKVIREGTEGFLEPRKSFAIWREIMVGKCREWTEEHIETAAVLCLVYGKFIEVWRQKEAALQSSQLTKILLANSAHEVRTPLNAIINYLEIALEGSLDQETRDNLSKSHAASKSLIYVINDLLDLTMTEAGHDLIVDEIFDLHTTVHEARDQFVGDAKRKGLEYDVSINAGVPKSVYGDQRLVRQVISNVAANAIQHTTSGRVSIELWRAAEVVNRKVNVEIVVSDTGAGFSNSKLDALFRDLEQVSIDQGDSLGGKEEEGKKSGQREHRTLGLGLATVARLVRNMNGQLRLNSEEGKGSRFIIQLPFELQEETVDSASGYASPSTIPASIEPIKISPNHISEGSVTLVENVSSHKGGGVYHKPGLDDITSLRSFRSGSSNKSNNSAKSDVDRLIEAISSRPLSTSGDNDLELSAQISNCKGSVHRRRSANSISGATFVSPVTKHPTTLTSSKSHTWPSPQNLQQPQEGTGVEYVTDSKTPLKAVKIPEEFEDVKTEPRCQPSSSSRVVLNVSGKSHNATPSLRAENLRVLVAEDDPVNSRIIKKRLEKSGHTVYHTVNGEECAGAYREKAAFLDVVLMDMQMPIVDGLASTKMIRSFERSQSHLSTRLSPRAALNGRIPIFAVSASLVEQNLNTYITAGFDGWILKPIDFKRLNTLLAGICDDEIRNSCIYQPGQWEIGGWFQRRHHDLLDA